VEGVWETFDWLRRTFPDLVIENCASGGNRLDWTLFARAHVNFANDQYTQPDCIRRILGRMAAFLPTERLNMIYGPYQRREYGDADWQILLGSAFGVSEPIANWTEGFRQGLRRHLAIHRAVADAQAGDFYRLTPDVPDLAAWEAWQLHAPGAGSGVLAAWRSDAPEPVLVLRPQAIDPAQLFVVRDLYAGTEQRLDGQDLARGIEVTASPGGAALLAYHVSRETRPS
jgi:alpha-galactosidase